MKLIDLLVQELPKRGGWPEGAGFAAQDDDGSIHTFQRELEICCGEWIDADDNSPALVSKIGCFNLSDDSRSQVISRAKYEAALAASQKVGWSGAGMPPVGCECEARFIMGGEWFFFRCVAVDCEIAFGWSGKEPVTLNPSDYEFRPIRSEADKKRDAAGKAIYRAINWNHESDIERNSRFEDYCKAYDAIAAGKIPGVKLED